MLPLLVLAQVGVHHVDPGLEVDVLRTAVGKGTPPDFVIGVLSQDGVSELLIGGDAVRFGEVGCREHAPQRMG